MTSLQAFFLGCLASLIPSALLIAFLPWQKHSTRLLIEKQPDLLEDQLAIDLRALVPLIAKDTRTLNEAETAARAHLIGACRQTLVACGVHILRSGGVSLPPTSIDNGTTA
jgi:hypothetical protein